jgi:hypothetical protein
VAAVEVSVVVGYESLQGAAPEVGAVEAVDEGVVRRKEEAA